MDSKPSRKTMMNELSMQSTFVGLSTQLAVTVPAMLMLTEYILIENSFQFQNLPEGDRIVPLAGLLRGNWIISKVGATRTSFRDGGEEKYWNDSQVGADRTKFRDGGEAKRQTPSIVADPTSDLKFVSLNIVSSERNLYRGNCLRTDLHVFALQSADEKGLRFVVHEDRYCVSFQR